jgi:DNA-binding IclR family transcriptional regulator
MGLSELSGALGAPKSSLLLLLRPMVAEGYLLHIDGRYRLGTRMFRLAAHVLTARKMRGLVLPYLDELARRTQETVFFAVLDREARIASCVEVVDTPNPIRYTIPIGLTMPLYSTAAGNVLLAHQERDWQDEYLRTTRLEAVTPDTLTDPDQLRRLLDEVRQKGVAVSIGRMSVGSGAVAAPVFTADDKLMGALVVAAPAERLTPRMQSLIDSVRQAAAHASGHWESDAADLS